MAADFLLFPSFFEGLGMVSVEAQASGLKVICSDKVPMESIVNPNLVKRLPLGEMYEDLWLNEMLYEIKLTNRAKASSIVGDSKYSIQKSLEYLKSIYSS